MEETKPFKISKQIVKIAFERVKANGGTYGVDEQSITDFEENLKDNLLLITTLKYIKIWEYYQNKKINKRKIAKISW